MKIAALALVAGLSSAFSFESSAARLACWELYANKGSRPTFTAEIVENNYLVNVKYGTVGSAFGEIEIPEEAFAEVTGTPITTNRSPYFGGQEFTMLPEASLGSIRLILPLDLSQQALRDFHFEAGALPDDLMVRQNGVLVASGYFTQSGGSTYTRMHCSAK